jgi:uncharacterized RDD family membrane protein YckC
MNRVGIGTRVLNFIVDTALIFLLSFLAYKGWTFYAYYYHIIYFPFYYFFGVILFFYYLLFESLFARTPGKWLSYSKIVDEKGLKPGFGKVFLRSIARLTIIDCFFFPFLNKMLHDYVSKTEVIEI